MIVHRKLILVVASAIMLLSCQKGGENDIEITFSLPYMEEVKATEYTTDNLPSFGVFATLEESGEPFLEDDANLETFMDNVPVSKQGGIWCATPKHYWPVIANKKLSFFAYAPHNGSNPEIVPDEDWSIGKKNISIQYTPPSNPSHQVDLCVSRAVLDKEKVVDGDNTVSLEFDHTLCWVTFSANYVGKVPDGCYLRIDELNLNNIAGTNSLVYNSSSTGDFFAWNPIADDAVKDASYTMTVSGTTLGGNALNRIEKGEADPEYTSFVTANGNLYLLPQKVNSAGAAVKTSMKVTFSYVKNDVNNTVIAQFYAVMDLPESEWEVAKKVRYLFTIDVEKVSLINFSAVSSDWIVDWKDSENSHSGSEIR